MLNDNSKIEEVFSIAWQHLLSGRSVEAVLADHPDHAAELEPMLRLTLAIRGLPTPTLSPGAISKINRRAQIATQERHASIAAQRTVAASWSPQRDSRPTPILSIFRARANVLVPLMLVTATIIALVTVTILRTTAPQPQLESYSGIITKIMANEWTVGDTHIIIDPTTRIHGQPLVGAKMTCVMQASSPKEHIHAIEVWIGIEPSPPLTVPTRSSDHPDVDHSVSSLEAFTC